MIVSYDSSRQKRAANRVVGNCCKMKPEIAAGESSGFHSEWRASEQRVRLDIFRNCGKQRACGLAFL
jgi:hypothetical protein